MITDLPFFRVYGAMARHALEAQRVSATNIAHAGQPGYEASRVESFDDFVERTGFAGDVSSEGLEFQISRASTPAAPNGNSVVLEEEIFNSSQAAGQHDRALAVYSKWLDMFRTAIGGR